MRLKRTGLKVGVALVAIGGASVLAWSLLQGKGFGRGADHIRAQHVIESQRVPAAISFKNQAVDSKKNQADSVVVAKPAEAEIQAVEQAHSVEIGKLPRPEIIQKFKTIQAKVFKSAEDQRYLKQMLMDSKYIFQLGQYLRDLPSLDTEDFQTNQNAVIDLLVEALRTGDSLSAEQAILDIVKDAQVEDQKLAIKTRELLAGVKAELLYQSTSIKPQLSESFSRVLPGPVSQKIWQNVQQQQSDNLALSEAEIQSRQARQRQ